jgi:hypothetical protein
VYRIAVEAQQDFLKLNDVAIGKRPKYLPYSVRSCGHSRTKSPKTKSRASDDDRTKDRPNKNFEPSAVFNLVAKKVASNAAEDSTDYSRNL